MDAEKPIKMCDLCDEEPARWEWQGLKVCSSCEEEEAKGNSAEIADAILYPDEQ